MTADEHVPTPLSIVMRAAELIEQLIDTRLMGSEADSPPQPKAVLSMRGLLRNRYWSYVDTMGHHDALSRARRETFEDAIGRAVDLSMLRFERERNP